MMSCGEKTAPVKNSTATPTALSASTATVTTAISPGFVALQETVGLTKKAIKSGKLDLAKTEFSKFEDSWKTSEFNL